jgi:hypothetical protein
MSTQRLTRTGQPDRRYSQEPEQIAQTTGVSLRPVHFHALEEIMEHSNLTSRSEVIQAAITYLHSKVLHDGVSIKRKEAPSYE